MSAEERYEVLGREGEPVSLRRLESMRIRGRISKDSSVRVAGTARWVSAESILTFDPADDEGAAAGLGAGSGAAAAVAVARPTTRTVAAPRRSATAVDLEVEVGDERLQDKPIRQVTRRENAETGPEGLMPELPVRVRWRFLTISAFVLLFAGGGALTAWYFVSPTPPDRFKRFAEYAKERLLASYEETAKTEVADTYRYNVRRTEEKESLLTTYVGQIYYHDNERLVQYAYEFRDGAWKSTQSQEMDPKAKTKTLHMGKAMLTVPHAEHLMSCADF